MRKHAALPAAATGKRSSESRVAEVNDMAVMVVAVIAALLLDLAIFAFLSSH